METIISIDTANDIPFIIKILNLSFSTVAQELNNTRGNASNPPAPGGRGLRGGGVTYCNVTVYHPHPNPLPSRERKFSDFVR